jgi:hypothetical protein
LWNPDAPFRFQGQALNVQPVLVVQLSRRREATSWRPWGGLHTEEDVRKEEARIQKELDTLLGKVTFPLRFKPLQVVRDTESAKRVCDSEDVDLMLIYAASGWTNLLDALASEKRRNMVFLRHKSGPVYLWYEILHNRFLRRGGEAFELDSYCHPGGMGVDDVVVDDLDELGWKLRTHFAVKNFQGQRIVALGGSWGWCCPQSPRVAQEKFGMEIRTVSYDDLSGRIQSARRDKKRLGRARDMAGRYLSLQGTRLETEKTFVANAFLLYDLFQEYMNEHQTHAFTIKDCMGAVIPMSETTACLPLSLLNDMGQVAFCESDFNVIPSGILLYYIAGTPVFLNDPTFPHHGLVTCAHCTAPRRMDGKNFSPTRVVTHFESDYGAAPKVELPLGTKITMICPDCGQKEWLGFTGSIEANPFYDICRAQYDIRIDGDWKRLLRDHRGFHWMMACGDATRELEYACSKIGVKWVNVSQS